jgi:hypothetical protein
MGRSVKVASHRTILQILPELLQLREVGFQCYTYLMLVGVKNIAPNVDGTKR